MAYKPSINLDAIEPVTIRAGQAGRYYGVSRATIWRYAKEGYFKAMKISPCVTLFSKKELDAFFLKGGVNESK
ncbi:AlpA family transcriptional regulator [Campylobacter sp. 19-13652]|uniref:helix-turn-helix transcriptional regulator n=1 Tax=Campylobacter sp. 19-13652 TaxID=2840180 RepID=UPI001C74C706|nr:helix-turn-helix domain-containing protein [Campylobacter sp. 19-13652]BCX79950.1 hypothetical protein LBC_14120 [Campylobacter sp. 19-13652]